MLQYDIVVVGAGGTGALLDRAVEAAEVIAYPDLGPEAIRKLTVRDLPTICISRRLRRRPVLRRPVPVGEAERDGQTQVPAGGGVRPEPAAWGSRPQPPESDSASCQRPAAGPAPGGGSGAGPFDLGPRRPGRTGSPCGPVRVGPVALPGRPRAICRPARRICERIPRCHCEGKVCASAQRTHGKGASRGWHQSCSGAPWASARGMWWSSPGAGRRRRWPCGWLRS